jgi:hypothetical protein
MRPGGLTAVCVIGLCLGILGLFGATTQCLGAVLQSVIWDFAQGLQQGVPAPQVQQQMQMQQEIMAVASRWMPFTVAAFVLNAIASGLLVAGSILGLRLSPRTNRWLVPGLICAILQALLGVGLQAIVQHDTQRVMARMMPQMIQQGGAAAPQAAAAMSGAMKVSFALSVAFVGGWALLQIVFYATALWYVLRKDVRSLFAPPTLEELAAEPTVGA